MNVAYLYAFYVSICSATIILSLSSASRPSTLRRLSELVATLSIITVYMAGMLRTGGVDYENYLDYFQSNTASSTVSEADKGFHLLTSFASSLGFGFSFYLLLLGVTTIVAILVMCRFVGARPFIPILLYVCYLAPVRDFSQIRFGLAIVIIYISEVLPRSSLKLPLRLILFCFAASLHFATVLLPILLLSFESTLKLKSVRLKLASQILIVCLPFSCLLVVGFFSAIDPRVSLYLEWAEPGYGDTSNLFVNSFFILSFLLLAFTNCFSDDINSDKSRLQVYWLVTASSLPIYVFSAYLPTIFATRISSLCLSFLPFLFAKSPLRFPSVKPSLSNTIFSTCLFALLISLTIFRETVFKVISRVTFDF